MLAVIAGRAELLLRRVPAQRAHLEAILLAAADASATLARLPGGAAAPRADADTTDAVAAVDAATLLVLPPDGVWAAAPAPQGSWSLERRLQPVTAAVPAGVLREVLVNLLLNALAVMPQGGHVRIEAGRRDGRCVLSVADSGPGLPVADPEAVFSAGFTTNSGAGRGVGLAACRQLLAAHGSLLTAARDGGPGAVFTIDTPAAVAPAPVVAPPAQALVTALEVVVIDDEPAVREMLADVLAEFGCNVTCHRDGPAALAAGAPGTAALALVDRRLPGLDGPAVAASLRARAPGLVVALMTGWDRPQDEAAAGEADFLLRKPIALGTLQDLLARADALRRERRGAGDCGTEDR
ncbi:response regulator [bacterium]|nr:response regulator [bacterium]